MTMTFQILVQALWKTSTSGHQCHIVLLLVLVVPHAVLVQVAVFPVFPVFPVLVQDSMVTQNMKTTVLAILEFSAVAVKRRVLLVSLVKLVPLMLWEDAPEIQETQETLPRSAPRRAVPDNPSTLEVIPYNGLVAIPPPTLGQRLRR